ncbi:hypothetical protein [Rhizobium sp. BK060]|uniref:hypothetical protein n=1 Tax=Rhizobium sp. BK060 TaxID=2587096 RepID=UPI001607B010|nr:hypothetical protein [Rhizobium sp. BK060]MBB3396618.1 hypothetical protein [Rhizobium sp. BK060]
MRLQLVAPTQPKRFGQSAFIQRIPSDLKASMVGMTVEMPLGTDAVPITITDKMQAIRLSLRTADAGEAKAGSNHCLS